MLSSLSRPLGLLLVGLLVALAGCAEPPAVAPDLADVTVSAYDGSGEVVLDAVFSGPAEGAGYFAEQVLVVSESVAESAGASFRLSVSSDALSYDTVVGDPSAEVETEAGCAVASVVTFLAAQTEFAEAAHRSAVPVAYAQNVCTSTPVLTCGGLGINGTCGGIMVECDSGYAHCAPYNCPTP